jgi:hypothetical protein
LNERRVPDIGPGGALEGARLKHFNNSGKGFGLDQGNDLLEAFKDDFGAARLTSMVSMASMWLALAMSGMGLESVVLGNY